MKSGFFTLLLLCEVVLSCNTKIEINLAQHDPIIMSQNGAELIQYWEFNNDENLWLANRDELIEIQLYKDSLRNNLGYEKLNDAIRREGTINEHYSDNIDTLNGDQKNADLVHTGTLGTIRGINYLEAQLLNYQLGLYPLLSHPTEFVAYIAINDSANLVRVYYCSSDQPWPPKHQNVFSAIEKDLDHGWILKYALHNHYEPKTNNYVGIMAPSMSDVQMFRMLKENYNLEAAIITNGFSTVEIPSEEFERFESY